MIDGARSTQNWNRFSYVAGNPIKFKDPTGHETEDYFQGVKDESIEVLKSSIKSGATTLLLGPAGLAAQSTIGTIEALSNPKQTFDRITEKYRNLASDDEHVRDNAKGRVTVAAAEFAFNAIVARKLVIPNSVAPNKPARSQLLNINGKIRIEKGVESVDRKIQRKLGLKIPGAVQKPWHISFFGKEIRLNPFNPSWRYFEKRK